MALGLMKRACFIAMLFSLSCRVGWACTPVTYVDESGHELSSEKVVEIKFNSHAYVIVGDVVELENVTEYEPTKSGRMRPHTYQRATVIVRKSWKQSKATGDKLLVYTDLNDSCSRSLKLGSQSLIYANGKEPVDIGGWGTISELGFSAPDLRTLNSLAPVQGNTSEPNNPLQPIAPKDGAPVER